MKISQGISLKKSAAMAISASLFLSFGVTADSNKLMLNQAKNLTKEVDNNTMVTMGSKKIPPEKSLLLLLDKANRKPECGPPRCGNGKKPL